MDDWTTMSYAKRKAFTNKLLQTYGPTCCICGLPIKPGAESCQHLTPRSKGGITTLENCRPAHKSCNYSLGNREMKPLNETVYDGLGWFVK
jgi:5-methylcytosine-specific restriction endonuclease McrA